MRGSLEELQFQSDKGKVASSVILYADLDRRVKAIEGGTQAVTSDGNGTGLPVPPLARTELTHQAAFDLLKSGQYEKATAAFQQFLVAFPGSALTDNAQYWLGESYYATRRYDEALKAFRVVVDRYKESRKLPGCVAQDRLPPVRAQELNAARDALTRVTKDFPIQPLHPRRRTGCSD
mgnify:CR=1 FL=1